MKQKVTVKDIAKELGVSASTVSRALSDSWEVSEATKKRIREMAEAMDYHPNYHASCIVTGRSRIIGFIAPELSSSFFSAVADELQKEINLAGYHLLIMQSDESPERERKNLQLMSNFNVDGIVLSTTSDSEYNADLYRKLIDSGIPLIFFNRVCNSACAPKIAVNDIDMAYKVTKHLIDQGCNRLIHLGGPESLVISEQREKGFIQAMEESGFHMSDSIYRIGFTKEDGQTATEYLIDNKIPFDGIFAFNDNVAIGAMRALKKRGILIPDDVAVTGFSDSLAATIIEPNLTSVTQPLAEMGKTSARLMLQILRGYEVSPKTIVLNAELKIRESSLRKG